MITRLQNTAIKPVIKPTEREVHLRYNSLAGDVISFRGEQELLFRNYQKAQKFADSLTQKEIFNLNESQIKELEGLQKGIKSFEGLSFKEIYFLMMNLRNAQIAIIRNCNGMCPACCVNGRPGERNLVNGIKKAEFEDFKNLTDGLKEMSERLHFDYPKYVLNKYNYEILCRGESSFAAMFYDSDCKDIILKDRKGKIHEFPELNKMIFDATGMEGLFDTAGWAPANTVMNERMERLAQYYAKPEHEQEIVQINISFNTYHGLYERALKYLRAEDKDGYERMKKKYTNQIANAMYCFTPLVNSDKYKIFTKCTGYLENEDFDEYSTNRLKSLEKDVFEALKNRYLEDLKNKNYKYVKNIEDVNRLVEKQKSHVLPYKTTLLPSARNNIFSNISKDKITYLKNKPFPSYEDALKNYRKILVDVNGEIYVFNSVETAKTDMHLNYSTKDKQTDDIYPVPDRRILSIKNESYK